MNGIQAKSQTGQAGRELGQHLRSADFFDVANHPTAAYAVTSSRVDGRGNLVLIGKLNVKGMSKEVEALMSFASADPVVASVNFVFDRADFDVRFGSGSFFDNLGDNLIADDVEMRMALIEDAPARKSN
jgi:polyisoprenoid-binding protein YceI